MISLSRGQSVAAIMSSWTAPNSDEVNSARQRWSLSEILSPSLLGRRSSHQTHEFFDSTGTSPGAEMFMPPEHPVHVSRTNRQRSIDSVSSLHSHSMDILPLPLRDSKSDRSISHKQSLKLGKFMAIGGARMPATPKPIVQGRVFGYCTARCVFTTDGNGLFVGVGRGGEGMRGGKG